MAELKKIGTSLVSPIGFGAMGMSMSYGTTPSDEERQKLLDAAYEAGSLHWDTSSSYDDSEVVLGQWFKRTGKRNEIFLGTKFGVTVDETGYRSRGDPEFIKKSFAESLKRLNVDYVDLLYSHRLDPTVPIEITVGAMAELVKEGKVKYLGLCEVSADQLRRAHAIHPISVHQIEYSPFVLDIERNGVLKVCRELGISTVAYAPLARGLVTGRFKSPDDFEDNDYRKFIPKYSKENFPKILEVVKKLEAIGKAHNANSSQVTLAWIVAQGPDFLTIPGTKSPKYARENAAAAKIKLSQEEVDAVRKIAEACETEIPGDRGDPVGMSWSVLETPPLK